MTVQLFFLEYLYFYARIHLPVNQVSTAEEYFPLTTLHFGII
jgi:hypothetical protein